MGINLGTSHCAVVASNGARHVIESYVGWPVDVIARRVVQKPFLLGREALDNRLILDLHRPLEAGYLKEGSDKDREAVQELLRHLLTLAGVEAAPAPRPRVHAVIGVPARALAGQQQQRAMRSRAWWTRSSCFPSRLRWPTASGPCSIR